MAIKITDSATVVTRATTTAPGYEPTREFGARIGKDNLNLPDVPNTAEDQMSVARSEFNAGQAAAGAMTQVGMDVYQYGLGLKEAEELERVKNRQLAIENELLEKETELLKEKNEWDHPVEWYETEMKLAYDAIVEKTRAEGNFSTSKAKQTFDSNINTMKVGLHRKLSEKANAMRTEAVNAELNNTITELRSKAIMSGDLGVHQQALSVARAELEKKQRFDPTYSDVQMETDYVAMQKDWTSQYLLNEALKVEAKRLPDGTIVTGADTALDIVANNPEVFGVLNEIEMAQLQLKVKDLGEKQANDLERKEADQRAQENRWRDANATNWQIKFAKGELGENASVELLQDLEKGRITDSQYRTLAGQIEKTTKETTERRTTVERTLNNTQVLDASNPDDRKAANEYFEKEGRDILSQMLIDKSPEEQQQIAAEYTYKYIKDTGIVVDTVRDEVARMTLSPDPEVAGRGAREAIRIMEMGDIYAKQLDDRTKETAILINRGVAPQEAAKLVHEGKNQPSYNVFKKEYEDKHTLEDAAKVFEKKSDFDLDDADPHLAIVIKSDMHNLMKEAYAKFGGNEEAAKDWAWEQARTKYGEWNGRPMMYPPSKVFEGEPEQAVNIHFEKSLESLGLTKDKVYLEPAPGFHSAKKKAYFIKSIDNNGEVVGVWEYDKEDYPESRNAYIVGVSLNANRSRAEKQKKKIGGELNSLQSELKRTEEEYKVAKRTPGASYHQNNVKLLELKVKDLKEKLKQKEKELEEY